MVAVVDDKVQRLVVVGTATPAGRTRCFVQDDPVAFLDKAHRGAQAGDTSPNNMRGRAAHMISCQRKAASTCSLLACARLRGGVKPAAANWSRIEP